MTYWKVKIRYVNGMTNEYRVDTPSPRVNYETGEIILYTLDQTEVHVVQRNVMHWEITEVQVDAGA